MVIIILIYFFVRILIKVIINFLLEDKLLKKVNKINVCFLWDIKFILIFLLIPSDRKKVQVYYKKLVSYLTVNILWNIIGV